MTALEFEKCCCCINLRTGTLLLGYLSLIGSIIMIVITGLGLAGVDIEHRTEPLPVAIGVAFIILLVVGLIFYPLLLAGVFQRKPSFVKAAWIYMIVYGVLAMILQLCDPSKQNAPGIIGAVTGLAIGIYWTLCVRSYELAMKEEQVSRVNKGGES